MTNKVQLRVPKTLVDGTRKYGSNWTQLEKDKHTKITSDDTWYYYTADREFIEDTGLGGVFAYYIMAKIKNKVSKRYRQSRLTNVDLLIFL